MLLKGAVDRSNTHPIKVIRTAERESGPWPLISEDMDGEPGWVDPDVTSPAFPTSTRTASVSGATGSTCPLPSSATA
ncbi:hypothetical protein [Streptomyces sp. NPDC050263]|uniref:hypothetical protein n=1 Tax=Streptomyces sp. NPDC050263 TaxID=3155037 RepID=UPI0034235C1A